MDLYAEQAGVLLSAGVDLFWWRASWPWRRPGPPYWGFEKPEGQACSGNLLLRLRGAPPTGTDVLACAIVMQGMGVAAFGLNCVDPAVAEEQLTRLHLYTDMPLIAEPSAGLPETLSDGTPAYQDNAVEFAKRVPSWAAAVCASSAAVAAPTRAISGRCGKRWSRSIFPRFHRWRRTRT